MAKYFITGLILLFGCKQNEVRQQKPLMEVKQAHNGDSNETIDSLKKTKIDWAKIPIHALPFGSDIFKKEWVNGDLVLEKYCCYPLCDKNYELNELDILFSKNTVSDELSEYEGNGHPSSKQGYFALRLPDVNGNKVLIYNYYDGEASDYKLCTMEIQIFNRNLDLMDKLIIEDGIAYECSWKRTFSIDSNYQIITSDYSGCIEELDSDKMINEKTYKGLYKILDTGKIVQVSE